MASSIATTKSRKGRTSIARRQIAHAHKDAADLQQPYVFPGAASYNFTPPVAGRWKFVGWGPGASGTSAGSGASGGYFEITRLVTTAQVVVIAPGGCDISNTSVTFPDGTVATATRGNGMVAGAATGGDVNLAGSAGSNVAAPGASGLGTGGGPGGASVSSAGGAGAPGMLPFRGGIGGIGGGNPREGSHGAGGGQPVGGNYGGGNGLVIAVLLGD